MPLDNATVEQVPDEALSFDVIVALARRHNLRIDEVKKKWEQFHMFDTNGDVTLSMQEFQRVVRALCGIPEPDPIPPHLVKECFKETDADQDGSISFEEFLLWVNGVQYCEEMMVPDPEERMLRRIARENGLDLADVERVKNPFFKYDTDKQGITEDQFHDLICDLLKTNKEDFAGHRMKRHWREVNPSGKQLTFPDFAVWWNNTYKKTDGGDKPFEMTAQGSFRPSVAVTPSGSVNSPRGLTAFRNMASGNSPRGITDHRLHSY